MINNSERSMEIFEYYSNIYNNEILKNDEKIDNGLNFAFEVSEEDRTKSISLNVGFLGDDKWEVIVRYVENLQRVSDLGATITNLLNNFAIVITTKENIETMSNFPEIIYIEKPKRLYFEVFNSVQTSCITPIQSEMTLYGNNIYISFIDSGIDYKNPVFMDENGIGGCILMNEYIVKVDEGLKY